MKWLQIEVGFYILTLPTGTNILRLVNQRGFDWFVYDAMGHKTKVNGNIVAAKIKAVEWLKTLLSEIIEELGKVK